MQTVITKSSIKLTIEIGAATQCHRSHDGSRCTYNQIWPTNHELYFDNKYFIVSSRYISLSGLSLEQKNLIKLKQNRGTVWINMECCSEQTASS